MFNLINNTNDLFEDTIASIEDYSLLDEEDSNENLNYDYQSSYVYEIEQKKQCISKKLKEIEDLEENWDNYSACTVDNTVIKATNYILEALQYNVINELNVLDICPSTYGTIMVNFFNNKNEDAYLSLEVGENNLFSYLSLDTNNNEISGENLNITKTTDLHKISFLLTGFYS